jgi:2-oxoglutarate ferredoxin oxidoreductase subunit gamma
MIVCFSGLGGQGIALLGLALGEAAARSGLNALQTQSYGAEARGGASYSTVIISKERILDIAPEEVDMLVAMSQPAYDRFVKALRGDGVLIYDSELVAPSGAGGAGIPATSLAKRLLGKELYANMVIFGFFVKVSRVVDGDRAREAIAASVPQKTVENNLRAFEIGYSYTQ